MSDDLRKQIARAAQYAPHAPDDDPWLTVADAVLAVVQPVIEQAERERDEAARFGESTQDWLRARVATLEAALDRIAHHPITQSSDAVTLRQIARDALDAALGEQDTTDAGTGPCGTCGATATRATGNCEDDCINGCAYPGQFSECSLGVTRSTPKDS